MRVTSPTSSVQHRQSPDSPGVLGMLFIVLREPLLFNLSPEASALHRDPLYGSRSLLPHTRLVTRASKRKRAGERQRRPCR